MTSTLYLFNPDNDMALANNNENYQAPASARQMADDLSTLPAWWAAPGDAVLVSSIAEAQRMECESHNLLKGVAWYSRRQAPTFASLQPWGWNPALRKQLLLWGVSQEAVPTVEAMEKIRCTSSRQTAVHLLPRLQSLPHYCGESSFCTTEQEIEQQVTRLPHTLLKAPYSSSGKGLRWGNGAYEPLLVNWCKRILKAQGGVVVEPLYTKVADFAMEFYYNGTQVTFVGYSLFHTDANGAYQGNVLGSNAQIITELNQWTDGAALHQLETELSHQLAPLLAESGYCGYLGVDMMVCHFADEYPHYRIHPCVELNLRMNMGVVSRLFYDRYVADGKRGKFVVDYVGNSEQLMQSHLSMQSIHPLTLQAGRITSGYLSLVPVTAHSRYRAYVLIDA